MKQILFSTLFFLYFSLPVFAQDIIYTANGNRLENAQLTDVTDDRILFTVQKSDKTSSVSLQRQNVLFAFNRKGNFLAISSLSSELAQAKKQLQGFLAAPARPTRNDFLVKAVPFEVIPAIIVYNNDVVNYKTQDNKSAAINKSELVAILYHDGHHELLRAPTEVAPLLIDIQKLLDNTVSGASTPAAVSTNNTVPSTPPAPIGNSTPNSSLEKVTENQQTFVEPLAPSASSTDAGKPTLNEADYQLYRKKALQKVDEFVSYLNVITDKKLSTYEKDKAIAQAAKLFMPAATIEVTSANRSGSRRYPIHDYLVRLKLLPYSSAKIEWSEVQYIKEMSQAADGNYYGVITGQQTFMGYGANGDNVVYSDVTQKRVRVKLEPYQVTFDGKDITKWNLLLGNIGVAAQ